MVVLPEHCTPTEHWLSIFSSAFHTCVPTNLAFVSTALGTASIVSWLFAQLPQIYKNWRLKSASGLSIYFLAEWLLGDVTNLLGAVLTEQAAWQVIVAAYYVTVDICLLLQYLWYVHAQPRRKARVVDLHKSHGGQSEGSETILEGYSPTHSSPPPAVPPTKDAHKRVPTSVTTSSPTDTKSRTTNQSPPFHEKTASAPAKCVAYRKQISLLPSPPIPILTASLCVALTSAFPLRHQNPLAQDLSKPPPPSPAAIAGQILSWTSTILYLCSRLPQIYKNFSRRSTSGLSPTLFIAAFFGNLFYSTSILTNPQAWASYPPYGLHGWVGMEGSERSLWVQRALPFWLGAAGVLIMDAIVGVQFLAYGDGLVKMEVLVDNDDYDGNGGERGRRRGRWTTVSGWMRGWVPSPRVSPRRKTVVEGDRDYGVEDEEEAMNGEERPLLAAGRKNDHRHGERDERDEHERNGATNINEGDVFNKLASSAPSIALLLRNSLPAARLALDRRLLSTQAQRRAQIMLSRALDEHTPTSSSLSRQFQYKPTASALKPAHPSALNAHSAFQTPKSSSLKRTASQISDLHEKVFFDENDFVEDDLIDLDEDESTLPAKKPHVSATNTTFTTPPLPSKTHLNLPSSTPLPWSSSPHVSQFPAPSNSQTSHKGPSFSPTSLKTPNQIAPPSDKTPVAQAPTGTKRRSLFWLGGNSTSKQEDAAAAQPQDHSKSPYPWNKTASATKEAQKQLRKDHKVLTKNDGSAGNEEKERKKKKRNVARVFLSDEQKAVLNLVADKNKSVFFTGSAGTGKSVLLREIIKIMRDTHKRELDRVAVTASTGLAACNIGGVTLHSFAGIGLGKETAPELVKKIKRNAKAKQRWLRVKVLIIDEVSMVDGDLFDKLEEIARSIRNNGRPFGGIQLVITGDFFQLPPVPDYGRVSKFSFDAATWTTSIEHTIGLTQVFRQKDPVFANMLNEMRLGKLSPKSIDAFRALNRPLKFEDDFEATELFPTRIEVDNANSARMRHLGGRVMEFKSTDGGTMQDVTQRDKLLSNCMAPPSITLKRGAQVMLIKNIDETLVNGSVGKVIAFMDEKTFEIYHEDEDGFQAMNGSDDERMTSSRKKLKDLIAKDIPGSTQRKWPLVRFAIADGSSRDLLCQPEQWNIELPSGEIQASRLQVPLILAWALSIHKAQGQTLDRVKVDLGKIFEKGQAYVALSRATCQEGLQINRFDPKKVMAHDRVRTFYNGLYAVNEAASARP